MTPDPMESAPLLSVIVPVYNEAATIDAVLRRLQSGPYPWPRGEFIVVDDGSTDATWRQLCGWSDSPGVVILRHASNQGKGAAIRTALAHARGAITVIQDADLEYDPRDLPGLIEPIRRHEADVVYGSRYLRPTAVLPWTRFRVAVVILNWLVRAVYGVRLTDEATCYKALRTDLLRSLDVQARRFDFCPEVTAKLCRRGVPIVEAPISYQPRWAAQGKKIGYRDAVSAAWTLLAWRVRRERATKISSSSVKGSTMPFAAHGAR
jgi:glycosyltransferase involved in cell wall biosynthesis